MEFKERIRQFEYKLNETDEQIIEYIILNKKEIIKMSIQTLSSELYTVPNTIVRLSKKLGYDGYSQMKNKLKEEFAETPLMIDDPSHLNIRKTLDLHDPYTIKKSAKMIEGAERVLFFGVGNSLPLCEMMVKNLKVVDKRSEFYLHRHEMFYETTRLTERDLVFFISMSGQTPLLLEIATIAAGNRIPAISLTHFIANELQELTDVNLFCYSPGMSANGYNLTDVTPAMIVLRILSQYYWKQNGLETYS